MGIVNAVSSVFEYVGEFTSTIFSQAPSVTILITELIVTMLGVAAWRVISG